MTKKKPEQPEWDDGRTIANMNVEGMPWYSPGKRISRRKDREKPEDREEVLTKQESRYYTWGALKAALLVVGILCAGLVLFVLFCQHVWFR
jgi:hypothetical protein